MATVAILYDAAGNALLGQKAKAGSLPVVIASDQDALVTTSAKPATSTVTSVAFVAGGATTTLLASNAGRMGATLCNTSSTNLYVKLGSGGTSSSFTAILSASVGYYEVPFGYTGIITGAWVAGGSGAALVTELTA